MVRPRTLEPDAGSRFTPPVSSKLSGGFRLAIELLRQETTCRELFEQLDRDGIQALRDSVYVPVRRRVDRTICDNGAVAYTQVGSPVTRLCPGFARLPERRAAITLIHEALHSAGMLEKPLHPEALSADQITRLVTRQCK